jgi:predicted DCC family thiol-disulfide oxidoreductase YuxK
MRTDARTIVLYDAACGFCRVSVAALMRWDRALRLRFVAIESAQGARLLATLTLAERLRSAHTIDRDGRLRSAGAAAPVLLAELPAGRPLAWLARRAPRSTEWAYRILTDARPLLGRAIPDSARRAADEQIAQRAIGEERIAQREHERVRALSPRRAHG